MSAEPKTIDQFPACTSPSANDVLIGKGNSAANTFKYSVQNLLGNSSANVIVSNSAQFAVKKESSPANSNVGGALSKSIWWDNTHIYVVLSNGHIRRVAHESF